MTNSVLAAVAAAAQQNAAPETPQTSTEPAATAPAAVDTAAIRAEGAKAERERCRSILASDAAKTRPALASHLAFDTDLATEAASTLLAKAAPETGLSRLDGAVPQPNIAAAPASDTEASDPAAKLMAAVDRARGAPV